MTETGSPKQRTAAVIYNPIKVDLARLERAVAVEEGSGDWAPSLWLATTVEDPGQGVTRAALDRGVSLVIAAGGDGTVRAVAEILDSTGVPLALLPSGTGNLLARNLNLTLENMESSLHVAFAGEDRAVDLGVIQIRRADNSTTRHAFVVMAGLGLDAKMLANTDDELKKRIGWLAYLKAIVGAMRDKSQLNMRYRLDESPARSLRAHTIIIGNCGLLPANVLLLPDAAIDDGLFDMVLLRPNGLLGWGQIWFKVVWENGVLRRTEAGRRLLRLTKEIHALRYVKGAEITVRLDREHDIELDGDSFGQAIALKARVAPGALRVRVPRSGN